MIDGSTLEAGLIAVSMAFGAWNAYSSLRTAKIVGEVHLQIIKHVDENFVSNKRFEDFKDYVESK